jgi:hypothetical protein
MVVNRDIGGWISGPCLDPIGDGAHELLAVFSRALERSEGNLSIVSGTLRVLLRGGAPTDVDCRLLASVLADATQVSNDPDQDV